MAERSIALGIGDESVPVHTHLCWYYSGTEQLRETLGFLAQGLREGDFCVILADRSRFDELLDWLAEKLGEDPRVYVERQQLALIDGAPTGAELLSKMGALLDGAMRRGYELIRCLGFVPWGAEGWPDDPSLLEFEAQLNEVVTSFPAVIVCTYGLPTVTGPTLIYGGLGTHPMTAIDGELHPRPPQRGTES